LKKQKLWHLSYKEPTRSKIFVNNKILEQISTVNELILVTTTGK